MTVNIKAKSYSRWTFSGISKAQGWQGAYKKAYFGVREMKLGTPVQSNFTDVNNYTGRYQHLNMKQP